jgi:hypothetical protein
MYRDQLVAAFQIESLLRQHFLKRAEHQGQWGPEFVAHVAEKRRLGAIELGQSLFGTLLVIDVGRRADIFANFSIGIAQGHGLIEVPAIDSILSAEIPVFERKSSPRTHTLPKAFGYYLPIFRVNDSHPGLRMRLDEIESLAGELEPNSIHEIRCPIRPERPGGYRELLQQPGLQLQIFIGSLQLTVKPARFRQSLFASPQFLTFKFRLAFLLVCPDARQPDRDLFGNPIDELTICVVKGPAGMDSSDQET